MDKVMKVSLVFLMYEDSAEAWAYRQMNVLANDPHVEADVGYFIEEATDADIENLYEDDDPMEEDLEENEC